MTVGSHNSLTIQSKAHLIMCLLHERAPVSRAMLQPDVNHRITEEVYFNEWTDDEKGNKQRPMMQSFVSKDDANRFTLSNPMTYILYELEDVEDFPGDDPSRLISTHLPMTIPRCDGKRFTGRGILKGVNAKLCSLDSFAKLISLFGYKPKERSSSPDNSFHGITRITDVIQFLGSFDEELLHWEEEQGFRNFLLAFPKIGYKYDESLSLRQNINMLSYFIRALVPVRVAIPDGQHRGQIFTYCLFGNFQIDSRAPLQEFQVDEWKGVQSIGKLDWFCTKPDYQSFNCL